MKKNNAYIPIPWGFKKYFKIMKITTFLLFVLSIHTFANTFGQKVKINMTNESVSVKEMIEYLEKETGYYVVIKYDQNILDKKIAANFSNASVNQVLDVMLNGTGMGYKFIDKYIAISPVSEIQQIRVTGTVSDITTGEPIVGANVIVEGTTLGVITDVNGKFTIDVPGKDANILISFVGFNTERIGVAGQTNIDVKLVPDITKLDEIVVIGYGTVKKSDLTGAVTSVSSKDLGSKVAGNIGQLLQGKIAGVEISRDGGRPDAGTNFKIRGTTSLNSTGPLVVVDGMIGDMDMVSPSEIDRIEVLKDASSAAIYGSRGANGVIIITTKKGQSGSPRINYSGSFGIATPGKKLEMLNASEYIDLIYDIKGGNYVNGQWQKPSGLPSFFNDEGYTRTTRTDWQNEIFKNAMVTDHNLDVSGGTEKYNYRFAAGYTNQESTIRDFNFKRYTIRALGEYKPVKAFKLGYNLNVRKIVKKGESADINNALQSAPFMPVKDPAQGNTGDYSYGTSDVHLNNSTNTIAWLEYEGKNKKTDEFKIAAQLYGEVTIFKDLTFRSQFQYENSASHYLSYVSADIMLNNQARMSLTENYSYSGSPNFENYFTYNKSIGIHSLNVVGGITYSNRGFYRGLGVQGSEYTNMNILLPSAGAKSTINYAVFGKGANLSYFGRINYALLNKYLLTLNYRADASYKFAPKNRWGYFPSLAVGWKVHEENFLKDNSVISQLKPRISWGIAGNDAIPEYRFYSNVWTGANNTILVPFGNGSKDDLGIGATINALPSEDIKWEETTTTDVGIDIGLFQNKLIITADYYNKQTKGILVSVPVPASTGVSQPAYRNAANVSNKGMDFQINYTNKVGELEYFVTLNGGYNKNLVESLGEGQPISGADGKTKTEKDQPMSNFFGYKTDGVISNAAEATEYNSKFKINAAPGDFRFQDLNGDGQITDADRTILGNPMPDLTYGLNLGLVWKNIDLNASLTGVYGNEIWNQYYVNMLTGMAYTYNASAEVLNRWKMEGDQTNIPRAVDSDPNNNRRNSNRYVEDGSFLRVKNITLGYTLSSELLKRFNFKTAQNFRVYMSAENMFTFSNYKGFDPEVGGNSSNTSRGIDYSSIPMPKTFMIGLQLGF